MGKLAVYKYFSFMILVITLLVAIFTIFGLFGGGSSPVKSTMMAMLVYILPFLVIANLVILVFWAIRRRWHWCIIPGVTFLCCIPYIGTIYQPGLFHSSDDSKAGVTIATYNVAAFGRELTGFKAEDILSEMVRQNVGILCFQEYMAMSGDKSNTDSYLGRYDYMAKGRDDMAIFSRYPIKDTQVIDFGPTNNSGMWADIDLNGRLVRVFNIHLETTGFNRTLRQVAKLQARGSDISDNAIVKAIYGNYTRGMVVRAGQVNMVLQEMRKSKYPIILCGDFNDVPYSYVYNTLKGDLVDGFKECGKGLMTTYRGAKQFRIDYIFHDESLEGMDYYKLDLSYSDHCPVFLKLAL